MNFKKYTSYFHDGEIHSLKHIKNSISLFIESSELLPEWNRNHISLSKRNTLSGILHLEGVQKIIVDGKPFDQILIKSHDIGDIFHLEIKGSELILQIIWENYPPKTKDELFSEIQIEATKIYWENLPDQFDAE